MPLREMSRERIWLLPPTLDELVPQDHPARFVAESSREEHIAAAVPGVYADGVCNARLEVGPH